MSKSTSASQPQLISIEHFQTVPLQQQTVTVFPLAVISRIATFLPYKRHSAGALFFTGQIYSPPFYPYLFLGSVGHMLCSTVEYQNISTKNCSHLQLLCCCINCSQDEWISPINKRDDLMAEKYRWITMLCEPREKAMCDNLVLNIPSVSTRVYYECVHFSFKGS